MPSIDDSNALVAMCFPPVRPGLNPSRLAVIS
jgi:hypothetical protein